jgi:hypothetical protein
VVDRHPRAVDLREEAGEGVVVLELRGRLLERGGHLREAARRLGERWSLVHLGCVARRLVVQQILLHPRLLEQAVVQVAGSDLGVGLEHLAHLLRRLLERGLRRF